MARLGPDATVLAFGDSLTYGTGAPQDQSYPAVLAALLGRTVVNAGVPGGLSAEGRARLPALLAEHRPALVILCHGGNDLLRRRDTAQLAANLRAMIELARSAGVEVALIGVPAPGLSVRPPQLYEDLAEEHGLPYDGQILHEILTDRGFKSDAIHPNAAGYRRLAEALASMIATAQKS